MSHLPEIHETSEDGIITYSSVPQAQLREVWPLLKDGLETVRTNSKEVWIAEDVYSVLSAGGASLYLCHDQSGELVGFGVFHVLFFPLDPIPHMNIWIGYSSRPAYGDYGVELARKVAAKAGITPNGRIVFATPQENGWTRRFKRLFTWYEV